MTSPAAAGPNAFVTGYLATRVQPTARGSSEPYEWLRHPGPQRPRPFSPVTPGIREAAARLPREPVTLKLGTQAGTGRRYAAGSARSAGHLLAMGPDEAGWRTLRQLLHGTGRLLRSLHTELSPASAPREAGGSARLSAWLQQGDGPGAASRLHSLARARLGTERLKRVRAWCEEAGPGCADAVFLHGGVSMGSLIPAAAEGGGDTRPIGSGALLAGEESAFGPAEYDIGWLLGELTEFRLRHLNGSPEASSHCADAARQFMAGYGRRHFDAATAGRMAALRVLTHTYDFAAYVGWNDDLHQHLDLSADLIETDGSAALCGDVGLTTPEGK
ncbi:MAG TPA: hypothetical protein VNS49_16010 [Streptomyces sp.]|nr:hypothetical protein [Streptomyces sp.]